MACHANQKLLNTARSSLSRHPLAKYLQYSADMGEKAAQYYRNLGGSVSQLPRDFFWVDVWNVMASEVQPPFTIPPEGWMDLSNGKPWEVGKTIIFHDDALKSSPSIDEILWNAAQGMSVQVNVSAQYIYGQLQMALRHFGEDPRRVTPEEMKQQLVHHDACDIGQTRILDGCFRCGGRQRPQLIVRRGFWTCPRCNGSYGPVNPPDDSIDKAKHNIPDQKTHSLPYTEGWRDCIDYILKVRWERDHPEEVGK